MYQLIFLCVATAFLCRSAQGQIDDTSYYVAPLQASKGTDCRNPHGLTGMCVRIDYCTHSTDHIDLRLYRPRNYISPCISPQMCCPTASIITPRDRQPTMGRYDHDGGKDDFD